MLAIEIPCRATLTFLSRGKREFGSNTVNGGRNALISIIKTNHGRD
jgi:hypothetical protein